MGAVQTGDLVAKQGKSGKAQGKLKIAKFKIQFNTFNKFNSIHSINGKIQNSIQYIQFNTFNQFHSIQFNIFKYNSI